MKIAIGMDVHDAKCAVCAVFAGRGQAKTAQLEFLYEFNNRNRRVNTNKDDIGRMISELEGHDVHVLIENSTIAHKVFWILKDAGIDDVVVAQSADLDRITKSVRKNDDNDAKELAAYMRRRLHGEDEFSVCTMAPPEWMAKKEFVRALYIDKKVLSDTKKRTRARLKVMGADLRKGYKDISCPASLKQLRNTRDPYLCYQAMVMRDCKARIAEAEKLIFPMFSDDENYRLLMTIPGIGSPLAAYLSSIIMDASRFDDKRKMEAFFGLVPRQRASAGSDPDCRTTHRGDPLAREYLGYAVMAHVKWCPDSVVGEMYARLKGRGLKHKKVIVACSRKMIEVIWSVLVHRKAFTTDMEILRLARGTVAGIEDDSYLDDDAYLDGRCFQMEVSTDS